MNKIFFNKLIRDKIPEKLKAKGCNFEIKKMNEIDFETELLKKVGEEASALPIAKSKEELISEIADVLAVIDEIKKFKNISEEQLETAKKTNFDKKGGFDQRLFLCWTSDDGYKTNETKYDQTSFQK